MFESCKEDIKLVLDYFSDRFSNYALENVDSLYNRYEYLYNDQYYISIGGSANNKILKFVEKISNSIITLSNELDHNHNKLQRILIGIANDLFSIWSDMTFSLDEVVKIKYKVYIEKLSYYFYLMKNSCRFNYFDTVLLLEKYSELYNIVKIEDDNKIHEIVKEYCELFNTTYNKNFNETDIIPKLNNKLTIFSLIEDKKITYSHIVNDLIDKLYDGKKSQYDDNINLRDYLLMCYEESQNLSHGTGYLLFSNAGEFGRDLILLEEINERAINFIEVLFKEVIGDNLTGIEGKVKKCLYDLKSNNKKLIKLLQTTPTMFKNGMGNTADLFRL